MSRINRTDPISSLIESLSVTKKSGDSPARSSESQERMTHDNDIEQLKKEVATSVSKLSTKTDEEKNIARKLVINKMIQWRFQSIISNAAHMSYLVESVNKSIQQDPEADKLLNQYIKEVTKS
ncbi:hypothetical protein [Pleionea sediminis]|uniref:hypothetical protein n=1 Tax=Pleionea sediminis TaxID=2569479 RepID=UPI001185DE52|nr:hypothetical protein [Pleionea sediminis]